jgi:hypothetical protein
VNKLSIECFCNRDGSGRLSMAEEHSQRHSPDDGLAMLQEQGGTGLAAALGCSFGVAP